MHIYFPFKKSYYFFKLEYNPKKRQLKICSIFISFEKTSSSAKQASVKHIYCSSPLPKKYPLTYFQFPDYIFSSSFFGFWIMHTTYWSTSKVVSCQVYTHKVKSMRLSLCEYLKCIIRHTVEYLCRHFKIA